MDMTKSLKISINTNQYCILLGKHLMISNLVIFKELFYLRKKHQYKLLKISNEYLIDIYIYI